MCREEVDKRAKREKVKKICSRQSGVTVDLNRSYRKKIKVKEKDWIKKVHRLYVTDGNDSHF